MPTPPAPRVARPVPQSPDPRFAMVNPKTGMMTNEWIIFWTNMNLFLQELVAAVNAIP